MAIDGVISVPDNPDHMMSVDPVAGRVRVLAGDMVLADSVRALRVTEVHRRIAAPVFYFPDADLVAPLALTDAPQTFCPLKGTARYLALVDPNDAPDDSSPPARSQIAWRYVEPLAFATVLAGHTAFYQDTVRIELFGAGVA
ncbi:MAG: DUF427 domain-containing protein [Pseudomonadota bacterium]